MSTATNGGDEQDPEVVDGASSNADGDIEMEGSEEPDDGPYCVCQEKSYGEMIGCDNGTDCPYQWVSLANLLLWTVTYDGVSSMLRASKFRNRCRQRGTVTFARKSWDFWITQARPRLRHLDRNEPLESEDGE